MAALSFSEDSMHAGHAILRNLTDSEWEEVLHFTSSNGITLLTATLCRDDLPPGLAQRIDRDIDRNTERLRRLRSALTTVSGQLDAEQIDYLLLKGFSLGPEYTLDPRL